LDEGDLSGLDEVDSKWIRGSSNKPPILIEISPTIIEIREYVIVVTSRLTFVRRVSNPFTIYLSKWRCLEHDISPLRYCYSRL